jgi:hyperosmotically inducible protein
MKRFVKVGLAGILVMGSLVPAVAQKNQAVSEKSQNRLAREVRHELVMLPFYNVFDNLEYKIDGGTVTLMGQVTDPVVKSDAEKAVKGIEGVERVNNQIEVLPLSMMDDRLRIALYRAIYGQPGIDTRYGVAAVPSIHIIVKNGNVTLEGVVANEMDKQLVVMAANRVPGVFSVKDNLRIEGKEVSAR